MCFSGFPLNLCLCGYTFAPSSKMSLYYKYYFYYPFFGTQINEPLELVYPEQQVGRGYLQYAGAHATDAVEEPLKIYKHNNLNLKHIIFINTI